MKRLFDFIGSTLLLFMLAPVLTILALLIRYYMGAGIWFRQIRAGRDASPFTMYKFRTMTDERDGAGNLLSDGRRLTGLGRFLRSTSLDELPQLFNVLKGEMSIVGPRPLYMKYLPCYTAREQKRHAMRPGITGWAQIHGRNFISWDDRLALDVWYVENYSILLDLEILAKTVWKVSHREGVAPDPDEVEMDLDVERLKRLPT